jgi:hypothetical protein
MSSMTDLSAHPVLRLTARVVAILGVIASGVVYWLSFLVAPMPWPLLFGLVWLAFVTATIAAARRWAYRPLAVAAKSLAFILAAIYLGQAVFGWEA